MNQYKVVAFDSPKEHYTADACVVWCFDDRFYKLLKAFGKQEGFKNIDLVKVAGGAKALAGASSSSRNEPAPDRDFLLGQIKASIRLHGAKRVVLMLHRDCGAYGGSKNFASAETEQAHHVEQLQLAKHFVAGEIPDVSVDAYFADFDGLYQLE